MTAENPDYVKLAMQVDREASTVTIAGRRFPAVTFICPPVEGSDDTDLDRAFGTLATGGGDRAVYVPAENGVLFEVEEVPEWPGLILSLKARTCHLWHDPNDGEPMWLPHTVYLRDGALSADEGGAWYWRKADPDWVAETIERLSCRPYTEPDGPSARLVRLNHFTSEAVDA